MKKSNLIISFLFMLLSTTLLAQKITQNCAVVAGVKGENIYIGNNEDWLHPFTSVFCYPASEGKLGRIMFGFSFSETNQGYCGGMNEKGLFIDGLGIPDTGWKPDEKKKSLRTITEFNGNLESFILERFESVNQVISFFNEYNVIHLTTGKFLIADKSGASIVVEWGQNKMQILKREGNYQIATNFIQSDFKKGNYPEFRYNLAEKIFVNSIDQITLNTIREVLSAVHWEELEDHPTTTLYSYICDLKSGDVYVYNFHNYEVAVKININNELKRGEKIHPLISLFPYETYSEYIWKGKKVVGLLYEKAVNNGVDGDDGVIALYKQWESSAIFNNYKVSLEQLISVVDRLKVDKRYKVAIELCKFIISEYPNADIAMNSLSMVYFDDGEIQLAKESLEKSLLKNPDNIEAKWYLEYINALTKPNHIDARILESYVGTYGERMLSFENGILYYQRGNQSKIKMIPVSDELFVIDGIDYFRIRIVKNKNEVVAIEGVYLDGRNYRYEKNQ